ncbi:MAG: glutaredoxin family protein [Candidatus Dormibacteria bacterium]
MGRRHCHLCQMAQQALLSSAGPLGLAVSEFDVDEDPGLARQFGDRVPVIRYRGRVLAEGEIDAGRLRPLLAAIAREPV